MKMSETETNRVIGRRLQHARTLAGVSLKQLAALLGVSYQQVQKYEKGTNGVTPCKLMRLSKTFGVPIMYFFQSSDPTAKAVKRAGQRITLLRRRLPEIEERHPEIFAAMCQIANALTKGKE